MLIEREKKLNFFYKIFCSDAFMYVIRLIFVYLNGILMYAIVICSNVGEDRAIGLVVNFSAGIIICEIDDFIMSGF
jgi:hypothetical protein